MNYKTKAQQQVWNIAVDIYGLDHDPHNTRTLQSIWRGWYTNEYGLKTFGWHASFVVAFGSHVVFLGRTLKQVREFQIRYKSAIAANG